MSEPRNASLQSDITEKLLLEVRRVASSLQPNLSSIQRATLDSPLDRDFGFDSLGRMELIAHLEKTFELHLPEHCFADVETPRDLLLAMMTAQQASPEELKRIELMQSEVASSPAHVTTLLELLDWHAQQQPGYPHIRLLQESGDDRVISYQELQQTAQQLAAGLQQRGLNPGDRVALMLPTDTDYFFSFFGILYAGGIPVPIYPPARPAQLEDHMHRQAAILNNAGCSFMITIGRAKSLATMLRARVNSLREVLTLDMLDRPAGAYTRPVVEEQDTAFIQYTSGSTGDPKGVVLSHANLLANIRVDGATIEADSNDVFISWLPLYHDMGLIGAWLGSLYFGAQLVIMSPLTFLARPVRWLQALHRYGGTLSAAPNFAYELCLNRISDEELEGLDLSRWRIAMNGAEAVSPQTIQRFSDRFAVCGFRAESMYPVYGLAECSVGLTFPAMGRTPLIDRIKREEFSLTGEAIEAEHDDDNVLPFVCCGRALEGHQVRIVDSASRELPERRQGRLQFRGPSATSGYYDNPQASEKLFDGDWLETGDLGYLADGELYLTGRSKDVIIRGGRNIYPHELELAVGEIDGIRTGRVAVFAVEDRERKTEKLVVLAETRQSDKALCEKLQHRINELTMELTGLAADDIVLAPPGSVLKTSSGKIRRDACRQLYEQGRIGEAAHAVWLQLLRLQWAAFPGLVKRTVSRAGELAYAVYAQLVFRFLAVLLAFGVLLLPLLRWRFALLRPVSRLFALLTATCLEVKGLEQLPSNRQNCIFVANHSSYLDSYVLCAATPRRFRFIAKSELLREWLPRTFLRRIGVLFVDRFDHAGGIQAMKPIEQAARAGDSLVFFPEGTFTHAPGLRSFHMGAFVAAVNSGLPVVPVAIRGARNILPGDSWLARRGKISVYIGKAIEVNVDRDSGDTDWEAALRLRDLARAQILEHCGEVDMGHEQVFPPRIVGKTDV